VRTRAKQMQTKIQRSLRAISPVIAVLLMIVIAVAASLVAYAWVMGYIGFTTNRVGKAIQIQSVAKGGGGADLLVYVQNVGDSAINLDPTGKSVVYVNDALMDCTFDAAHADGVLDAGETATLTIAGAGSLLDAKLSVKVQTTDGTFIEKTNFSGSTGSSGGPGTYTLAISENGEGSVTADIPPPYTAGTVVTLTANPDASTFTAWGGDLAGSTNPTTITMDGDKSVTATFTRYYKTITFNGGGSGVSGSGHVDFPALISITDPQLASRSRADGYDIYFTQEATGALASKLDHEVESFNKASGTLVAWVRIPTLSAGTTVNMFYGAQDIAAPTENPTGVWDSNYQGVYHLSDIPTGAAGDIEDSKNAHDGTSQGSMNAADQVTGKVSGSLDFDNSNDYINCGDGWMEDPGLSQMTVEAWVYKDAAGDDRVAAKTDSGSPGTSGYLWSLGVADTTVRVRTHTSVPSYDGGAITYGNWWYVAFTYNDNTNELKIYRNEAVTSTSATGAIGSNSEPVRIAENDDNPVGNSRLWDGRLDEVRFSNVARSQDWIISGYRNTNNPGAFFGISGEFTVP
jgi:FlaG/FlaF family flagellin (archaellin)